MKVSLTDTTASIIAQEESGTTETGIAALGVDALVSGCAATLADVTLILI